MSEAERNEAIDEINAALNKTCIKGEPPYEFSSFKLSKVTLCLAITALHSQSEAEKKIEAVKALCDEQEYPCYDGEGYEWSDGCKRGRFKLSTEILKILEADDD